MHAAILHYLAGDHPGPEEARVETTLGSLPAVDAERTPYLDGRVLQHGTAAGRVMREVEVPVVTDEVLTTERDEQHEKVAVDWYADLENGWVGVNSSDGEFLVNLLARKHGLRPAPIVLDLDAWVAHLSRQPQAAVEGYNYSVDGDDGDIDGDGVDDRAGAGFGADAGLSKLPDDGNQLVLFRYSWDGTFVHGVIARSGYVAMYSGATAAVFARWLADEVLEYAYEDVGDRTEQLTLGGDSEEVSADD